MKRWVKRDRLSGTLGRDLLLAKTGGLHYFWKRGVHSWRAADLVRGFHGAKSKREGRSGGPGAGGGQRRNLVGKNRHFFAGNIRQPDDDRPADSPQPSSASGLGAVLGCSSMPPSFFLVGHFRWARRCRSSAVLAVNDERYDTRCLP
jgi:hypothetical protein